MSPPERLEMDLARRFEGSLAAVWRPVWATGRHFMSKCNRPARPEPGDSRRDPGSPPRAAAARPGRRRLRAHAPRTAAEYAENGGGVRERLPRNSASRCAPCRRDERSGTDTVEACLKQARQPHRPHRVRGTSSTALSPRRPPGAPVPYAVNQYNFGEILLRSAIACSVCRIDKRHSQSRGGNERIRSRPSRC